MFCMKCGHKLDDNMRFCPACGAPQARQQSTPPKQQGVMPPQPAPQQKAVGQPAAGGVLDTFEANMGPVEIFEDHLTIYTRTLAGFKTKMVPSDVVFAQVKRVERHPKGTRSPRFASIHIDTGAVNNVINRLENEMTFETDVMMEDAYAKIMKHYQAYLSQQNGGTVVQQISSADEIKKYKELLDSGIITQEEFDAKKRQLLGL